MSTTLAAMPACSSSSALISSSSSGLARRAPSILQQRRYRMQHVCRAELGNEEWLGDEAQRPHFGGSNSASGSADFTFGAGSPGSSSSRPQQPQDQHEQHDEPPMIYTPDPDMPPVLVQDWRAFRARLVAMESGHTARAVSLQLGREERWAHVLAQPERGCLLVARPRPGLGMFTNTVILLLEHEDGEGSSGLVINMPTPLLINNLGLEEDIADAFRHCPLFIGGPVTKHLLHVLHGRRDVEGALEIIEGVYAGGVESASALVRRGDASPRDFMLLSGYSGWGPWQLQQELRSGTWLPVAASQAVIMDVLRESLSWSPNPAGVPHGADASSAAAHSGGAESVKKACWQRVLWRAGIEPHMLGML